ncbi:MAG: hypothetical protein U0930_13435 [Pirellulales bacterium]
MVTITAHIEERSCTGAEVTRYHQQSDDVMFTVRSTDSHTASPFCRAILADQDFHDRRRHYARLSKIPDRRCWFCIL